MLLLSYAILFVATIKVLFPLFKCYPISLSQLHSSPPGFPLKDLISSKEGHFDLCLFCLSLSCRLALIVSNSQGDLRQMLQHSKGNNNILCVWVLLFSATLSGLRQITVPLRRRCRDVMSPVVITHSREMFSVS